MKTNTPKDLFIDQLRDLHSVESQLSVSLPELARKAEHPPLKEIIADHAVDTQQHLKTVTAILQKHGQEPGEDVCKAMKGLIMGGDEHLDAVDNPQVRDLMLVAHSSRIEHYEIAAYEIARRLAVNLGLQEEADLLDAILLDERLALNGLMSMEPELFQMAV